VTLDPPGTTNTYPVLYGYTSPSTVTVTAHNYMTSAGSGYVFMRWEGDATSNTNPLTILVDGQKTIRAFYAVSDPITTPVPTTVPTPFATRGDANSDGNINIVDALLTAQHYVGLNPSGFNEGNADTNCDGSINIVDALLIAQYYVGLITQFC
jgi:hypothetical protein